MTTVVDRFLAPVAVPPTNGVHVALPPIKAAPRSALDDALALAARGFRVVWVHPPTAKVKSPGKQPILDKWQKVATDDPDTLRRQYASLDVTDPNVGIVLGAQPDGSYLIAVDIDDAARFAVLESELGPLPETLAIASARGDKRLYHIADGVDQSRLCNVGGLTSDHGRPITGVDVKVEAGQVVGPGSLHASGVRYHWANDLPIAELPELWLRAIQKPVRVVPTVAATTTITGPAGDLVERARRYIANMPQAIEFAGGNRATWNVCRKLLAYVQKGMADSVVWPLLLEWNKSNAKPPWTERELQKILGDASANATEINVPVDRPPPGRAAGESKAQRIARAILAMPLRNGGTLGRPEDVSCILPDGGITSVVGRDGGWFRSKIRAAVGLPVTSADIRACIGALDLSKVAPLTDDELQVARRAERMAREMEAGPAPWPVVADHVDDGLGDDVEHEADVCAADDTTSTETASQPLPARVRVQAPDARPLVTLRILELHEAVDVTGNVLRLDATIFERDHELVSVVVTNKEPTEKRRAPIAKGTPIIHPLEASTVTERLTKVARFQRAAKPTKEEQNILDHGGTVEPRMVPCLPPPIVVSTLCARKSWPVPPIIGIAETWVMRRDGSLCTRPGYDEASGYYYAPSCQLAPIPDHPTQAAAVAALAELEEPFLDFPHVSRADRLVPVAATLTVLAQPAIDGSRPMFVFDAATRGTGKTLQAEVVSVVTTGRSAARLTYPETDEELEKVLSAYALAGVPLISIDNVTRTLGGGPLDKVLTATGDVELRVLGASQNPTRSMERHSARRREQPHASVTTRIRRSVISRCESEDENPEARSGFKHDPLIPWVRAERPRLLRAAYVVLRAYACKGWPETGLPRWGGFEAWTRVVAGAIRYAGGESVLDCKPKPEERGDGTLAALDTVLAELPRLSEGRPMTVSAIVSALFPQHPHDGPSAPDGWEGMRGACEALGSPRLGTWDAVAKRRLGEALRRFKGPPPPRRPAGRCQRPGRAADVHPRKHCLDRDPGGGVTRRAGGQGGQGGQFQALRARDLQRQISTGVKGSPRSPRSQLSGSWHSSWTLPARRRCRHREGATVTTGASTAPRQPLGACGSSPRRPRIRSLPSSALLPRSSPCRTVRAQRSRRVAAVLPPNAAARAPFEVSLQPQRTKLLPVGWLPPVRP